MNTVCKITGTLLVLLASGYYAVCSAKMMEARNNQLRKLYGVLLQLKSEILYMSSPLPECFRKMAYHAGVPFQEWLNTLANRLETMEETGFVNIWKEEMDVLYQSGALEKSDLEPLYELSDRLGSIDVEVQVKSIDYALMQLERKHIILQNELGQKKKVIITLSMFGGFMALILLL